MASRRNARAIMSEPIMADTDMARRVAGDETSVRTKFGRSYDSTQQTKNRRSNAGAARRSHGAAAATAAAAAAAAVVEGRSAFGPRRTISQKLHGIQQARLRRLHHYNTGAEGRSFSRSQDRREGRVYYPIVSAGGGRDRGRSRWQWAIEEILLGMRSTDAIMDANRFKDRKFTYWHGQEMKREGKAAIDYDNTHTLKRRCRACATIVEQSNREIAQKKVHVGEGEEGTPDPEGPRAEEDLLTATPENVHLVFGLFHSVPEVNELDSIYKKHLFPELRIRRFAAGGTVFKQWCNHDMIGVILEGSVHLTSRHTGVWFQAGIFNIGEVIGSLTAGVSNSTAKCAEATTLLCLDSNRFSSIVGDSAIAERVVTKGFLKCNPVFSTLSDEELNTLQAMFSTVTLDHNQVLCKEGIRADHVYLVRRGFLRVYKAFLPVDGLCPRPPSSRGTSKPTSKTTLANKTTGSAAEGGIRVRHFDVGEIGPRELLGENGVLRFDKTPATTAAAAAAAPTSGSTTLLPSVSNKQDEGDSQSRAPRSARRHEGDVGGPTDAGVLSNATKADGGSTGATLAPQKATYIVSAAASGGKAEVCVAKAHDLKKLESGGFCYCWKTAERLHQARVQAWSAAALAEQLRRQIKWEAIKRDVVVTQGVPVSRR